MKVFAINGSPKENGNTALAVRTVLHEMEHEGIETGFATIGQKSIRGCLACGKCAENKNRQCAISNDAVNELLPEMLDADALVVGSPTYYSGLNGTVKSFLDRAFYAAAANGSLFRHKIGASVIAVRRSGGIPAFDQINKYFQISEMITIGSSYWNVVHGMVPGEAAQDAEGMQVMRNLGQNIAWLLKLIEHGKGAIQPPQSELPKARTNFIR
ncbi:MAG: flavodoxin family protein [Planctomycetaceae bacterium]|jgi:multimeric flavodoxin WrbA|nr:flavodoxin family protein [Planctomycetaceae bacterium]